MIADDLVEIAKELARRDVRRPRSASLRRAVSSAYYALFHSLAEVRADALVGRSRPWSLFTPVYRSLDHRQARKVLNETRSTGASGIMIKEVGYAFVRLQDARVHAGYNPEPLPFNRDDTIELITLAETAIAALATLSKRNGSLSRSI